MIKHRVKLVLVAVVAFLLGGLLIGEMAFSAPNDPPSSYAPTYIAPCTSNSDSCRQQRIVAMERHLIALEKHYREHAHPQASPSPSDSPSVTPSPSPDPSPSTSSASPSASPSGSPTGPPTAADFPTAASVGPGTDPTAIYAGDCYFDASESGQVIENKIVDCNTEGVRFAQAATGIVFRNSIIRGQMLTTGNTPGDPGADQTRAPVFTVENSKIIQSSTANAQDRALCCAHFVVRRSLIQGTHSGLWAYNGVTLVGNYVTTDGTDSHSSGMRVLKNTTLRDNTAVCKPVTPGKDGGCSAAAVFYREFGVTQNLTIEHNYWKQGTTASGAAGGPWYATRFAGCNTNDDCVNIRVTGNLFDKGWGTDAGEFPNDAGDVWQDNYWTDGVPALVDQSR